MQIPIHVGGANLFLNDAADRPLRESASGVVQKDGLAVRGASPPPSRTCLQEQLLANPPIGFPRFLRFAAVGHDSFFVALAAHAQHFFAAVHVGKVQSSELAYAEACCVEKLPQRTIAP